MSTWIETLKEVDRRNKDFDVVRLERINLVEQMTGRPLIIYATDFSNQAKVQASRGEVTIDLNDKLAFDEVTRNIEGENLDVLLHSPGGSAEAAESIIELLRSRFVSLRFIVPDAAKSAATMMCCAGDEILIDERSELGPIDPQMFVPRSDGNRVGAPAQAIIKQFEEAKKSLAKNPQHLPAWLPILQSLAPALPQQCEQADLLAANLIQSWLKRFMLKDRDDKEDRARSIATFFSSSSIHLSHGRRIGIEQLRELDGFRIVDLRESPELRDAIWNVYLALSVTFDQTSTYKLAENGKGERLIRHIIMQQIRLPIPQAQPTEVKKKRHGR